MRGIKEGHGKATVVYVCTIARNKRIITKTTLRISMIRAGVYSTLILKTEIYRKIKVKTKVTIIRYRISTLRRPNR